MGPIAWNRFRILPLMLMGAVLAAEDTACVRLRNTTDHAWELVPLGASSAGFALTAEVHLPDGTVTASDVTFGGGSARSVRLSAGACLEMRPGTPTPDETLVASFTMGNPDGGAERESFTLWYELQRTPEGTGLGSLSGSFGSTGTATGTHFAFVPARDAWVEAAPDPEEAWHRQVYRSFTWECAIL
jgi:hypothetical protein